MNKLRRIKSAFVIGVVAITMVGYFISFLGLQPKEALAGSITLPGGKYVAISPVRICDTRVGTATPCSGSPMLAGSVTNLVLPSADVPSTADAVVVNVTVVSPSAAGYLTVFPTPATGNSVPTTSNLNFSAGQTVPNLVTVEIGSGASISIANESAGQANLIVDLEGYYETPAASVGASGHFYPLSPSRIVDTRTGSTSKYAGSTLVASKMQSIQIDGVGGIPSSGVSAVVMNVTATNTNANGGYLTIWPDGTSAPVVSNLNWSEGQTIANRVMVSVGSDGKVDFESFNSNADVIVDVNGWFSDSTGSGTSGSLFVPISPQRLIDTRTSSAVGPNSDINVPVAGVGSIPLASSTNPPDAVVTNVTEAGSTVPAGGYLTVYPGDGSAPPISSDLNFSSSQIVPNMSVTKLGKGSINVYNALGSTQVVVDADGYFTAASIGTDNVSVIGNTTITPSASSHETVTVLVTTPNGSPVSGDQLSFSTTNGVLGSCGILSTGVTPTTGSNGEFSFTYTASTVAGTCDISVTDFASSGSGQLIISQALNPPVVGFGSAYVNVNSGSSQITISLSLTQDGQPISGTVNLALTGVPAAACGTLSTKTVAIGISGSGTVNYTPGASVGVCQITGTDSSSPSMSGAEVVNQTIAGATSSYSVSIKLLNASLPADGISSTTATVTVTDKNGVPVPNDPVSIYSSSGCAVLSSNGLGTTNSSGQAIFSATASIVQGGCSLDATEATTGGMGTSNLTLTPPPATVSVDAGAVAIPADGTSTTSVLVTVTTDTGPLTLDSVALSSTCGTLSVSSGVTNQEGQLSATLTAPAASGLCVITANESATSMSGETTVAATSATQLSIVSVAPAVVVADGSSTTAVSVTVMNGGSPENGATVGISLVSGVASGCGSLSAYTAITNSSGVASFTYKSSKVMGNCAVTAEESLSGAIGFGSITQLGPPNQVLISVNGSSPSLPLSNVNANDPADPVVISVEDGYGNPIGGAAVSITPLNVTNSVYTTASCGTLGAVSGTTASDGKFVTTYTPIHVGFCAFLVTSPATPGALNVNLVTQASYPASVKNTVTVVRSTPSVLASDTSMVNMEVRVTNPSGIPVVNDPVLVINPSKLPASFGGNPACGGVPSGLQFFGAGVSPFITNANGMVTVPYQASTYIGNCNLLTIEAVSGSGGLASFGQVATPPSAITPSFSVTSASAVVAGGAMVPVTLTVNNGSAGVEGDGISITPAAGSSCGSISSSFMPYTSAKGQVTFDYTPSSSVGFCDLTFTESYTNATYVYALPQVEVATSSKYSVSVVISGSNANVTVDNGNGVGIANDPLSIVPIGCSGVTVGSSTGSTSANGTFTVSFSGTLGSGCDIYVTEAITGGSGTAV